jgi:hypothetical protein
MSDFFIEPRPKGQPEGTPINDYIVADRGGTLLATFKNRVDAITWTRHQGHNPFIIRLRHLNDKTISDHWRAA